MATTAIEHPVRDEESTYAARIEHVSKSFGRPGAALDVLDDISLDIGPGEFVCLLGASGCGKSTLLNMVAGLDRPTAGRIDTPGGRPALMFQEHALFPWLTAGRNIELALRMRGVPRAERRARTEELLELTSLLTRTLSSDEIGAAVLGRGGRLLGACGGVLAVVGEDGRRLRILDHVGLTEAGEAGLAGLEAQSRPPVEVIVVVDRNPRLLDRVARRWPAVRVLSNTDHGGLAGARNTALAAAVGDVVAFLDDDAVPAPDWLERLAAPYADPAVQLVGGWVEPRFDERRPAHPYPLVIREVRLRRHDHSSPHTPVNSPRF